MDNDANQHNQCNKSSIIDADVLSVITSIWYRCPIHEMNGHVEYMACPITHEEDVWLHV